ncbi:MAG: restriction endonuclease subunit S [Proteobacteria bacterium]|nr:restriction endonuclease subunit S [Pseudomonadota bacterium]
MNEWTSIPLIDVIELVGGGTPKTSRHEYWDGNIPWLSVVDFNINRKFVFDTEKKITQKGLENSSTNLLDIGDIIISARGTVGAMAVLAKPMTFNQSCYGIRGLKGKSITDYIYYLLSNTVAELKKISHGGVFDTITRDTFREILIALPPLQEQKAIASILSSLDNKIDLLHRQNKTLEAMAKTLFRQWFIEEAREDWEDGTIADLVDFNPSRKLAKGSMAPYLEMAALSTTTFNPDKWYDREFSSGTKFINGDTLIARITPCLENGKTAFITFLEKDQVAWGSTEYIVMRPKAGLHHFFVYVLARNSDFRDYAEGCMEGSSGRQRVNVDHLKDYDIKIPPESVIRDFNSFAESIVPKLHSNFLQIRTLEKLRDTLLPKLMSGEVRVAL